MKKEVFVLLLIFLFSVSIVSAQNSLSNNSSASPIPIPKNISAGDIKNQTNQALAKEVKIPDQLKIPAKILFGIDESMPFSRFVVFLMLWLFVFMIIFQIVKIMPFFKKGAIQFVAALAISILAANLGGIDLLSKLYYDLTISKIIDATSPGAFVFAVIALVLIWWLLSKIISKVSIALELGEVESSAMEARTGYRLLRVISSAFGVGSAPSVSSGRKNVSSRKISSNKPSGSSEKSSAKESKSSSEKTDSKEDSTKSSTSEEASSSEGSGDIYDLSDAD